MLHPFFLGSQQCAAQSATLQSFEPWPPSCIPQDDEESELELSSESEEVQHTINIPFTRKS